MKEQRTINTLKKFIEVVDFAKTDNQKPIEKLFIKTDIFATIIFIKKFYNFSVLSDIEVCQLENGEIELDYNLYDVIDEEMLILSIIVKNNEADSIQKAFQTAAKIENRISKKYGIKFVS